MDRDRPWLWVSLQGSRGGGSLSVRRLLLSSFLLVIAFLAAGQAFITNRGLEEELLAVLRRELQRELELAPLLFRNLSPQDPDSAARALSRSIGYPVTLLDREGRVIGASSDLPFQLRGLRVPVEETELSEALSGDVGFSTRRGSGEVEIRLFTAGPVILGNESLLLQVAAPLNDIRDAVRQRIRRSLFLALPAILLALLLTYFVGRGIVRPLQTIGRRSRALSAGDFSRKIPGTIQIQELRELAGTFNRMTEELARRFQSLEVERDEMQALIDCMGEAVILLTEDARVLRANQAAIDLLDFPSPVNFAPIGALIRQPSLRTLLEGAVIRPFAAREITLGDQNLIVSASAVEGGGAVATFVDVSEIRRLEMVRRDFVANASHELKTPLTAMRGFAETLLEDDLPEELRGKWLASIRDNTLRLQRLVDDLLDLSRLESGGWAAKQQVVELGVVVRDVLAELGGEAEIRGLTLKAKGEAWVVADEQGLEQILRNLVENAIRYTPKGGKISLRIEEDLSVVRVSVRDTGIGIPTSALPRIFERFYRVDPARSRAEGGTGLGLAIVRHLVHAMGGEVRAESELGKGTTVFFTLPRAVARDLDLLDEGEESEMLEEPGEGGG